MIDYGLREERQDIRSATEAILLELLCCSEFDAAEVLHKLRVRGKKDLYMPLLKKNIRVIMENDKGDARV